MDAQTDNSQARKKARLLFRLLAGLMAAIGIYAIYRCVVIFHDFSALLGRWPIIVIIIIVSLFTLLMGTIAIFGRLLGRRR